MNDRMNKDVKAHKWVYDCFSFALVLCMNLCIASIINFLMNSFMVVTMIYRDKF